MLLQYLQTYSKNLIRIENVLVAAHQIVKTESVFGDIVNVSVNKKLEIRALRQVTMTDGSTHFVAAKSLYLLINCDSAYSLLETEEE